MNTTAIQQKQENPESILVVEDSAFFGLLLRDRLQKGTGLDVLWCKSMAEAEEKLAAGNLRIFIAILDYNLPDAPDGQIVDAVLRKGIPSIVFTSDVSEKVRSLVWSKKVVDYTLKGDPQSVYYIITMIKRLQKNIRTKVMVVDDSPFFNDVLQNLLKVHQYDVYSASNGQQALDTLKEHPDIKMIITDYHMPIMDGFTLTQKVRETYSKENLAIIGISSEGDHVMGARFIKCGANDFLIKQTFLTEEFYCRVTQNIETLEYVHMVREAAIKDFLTGLYNRRYFFDVGQKYFANADRKNIRILCCMMDIDFFKKINDTYGHDAGDLVLKMVAEILQQRIRQTDIVARMGGEEFCILCVNMDPLEAPDIFERLRKTIEDTHMQLGDDQIRVTVSMGVAIESRPSLDEMIRDADQLLYQAKHQGRNQVVMA